MKELMAENKKLVAEIENKLWQSLDIIRGSVGTNDFHFILYLLILQRDGVFIDLESSKPNELKFIIKNRILSFENKNRNCTQLFYQIYEPIISSIRENSLSELMGIMLSLNQQTLENHAGEIFDSLLYKISKSQGRDAGEFILPVELSRLICNLADLPENSNTYNPFAGVASFGVFLNQKQNYIGQEINEVTWAIGTLRIMAYRKESNSILFKGNSFLEWNPTANEKFDFLVSAPPFGIRLPIQKNGRFGNIKTCEHFLIENALEDLNEKGKLIIVIPNGFLFRSGAEQNLRKFLIENDLLDLIISLPGGLLRNTSIPINIVVINKNKKNKGIVRFINANKFVKNITHRKKILDDFNLNTIVNENKDSECYKIISNSKIQEFDYNLSVLRYFADEIEIDKNEKFELLGSLINVIRAPKKVETKIGKFIRIRNLNDDKLKTILDLKNIEEVEIPKHSQYISESCLLLALRWKTLKPTFFEYTGEPIFVSTDIISLRINEAIVDSKYLINELQLNYVTDQIESIRSGSFVPNIKKEDLLKVKIVIPSLEVQRAKVKGAIEAQTGEEKKISNFRNAIQVLNKEIIEQNTYLRHTLAGPSSNLKDSIGNIKKILSEKVMIKFPEIMNLKVSDLHELNFGKYLEIIERDIAKISDAVSKQLKVETNIDIKPITSIDILSFIRTFVGEYKDKKNINFAIEFDFDEKEFIDDNGKITKTFIYGNVELLTDLFNNLISNAVSHAFELNKKNRIEIMLIKYADHDFKNEISIVFSNTGKSFPKNYSYNDYIRKGSKAGDNAGDGFGGWYINEIIKKLNGNFDIIDERGPEGLSDSDLATSFEINFPIYEHE